MAQPNSVCIWINQIQYEIFTAFRHLSQLWIITAHFGNIFHALGPLPLSLCTCMSFGESEYVCGNKFPFVPKQQQWRKETEQIVSRMTIFFRSLISWKYQKEPAAHVDKCSTTELYIIHRLTFSLCIPLSLFLSDSVLLCEPSLMIFRHTKYIVFECVVFYLVRGMSQARRE